MNNQIREEINQILMTLPDQKLPSILDYLKQVKKADADKVETANMLKKIFEEDAELLKKLAQ